MHCDSPLNPDNPALSVDVTTNVTEIVGLDLKVSLIQIKVGA